MATPRRRIVGVSTKMYFSAARTRQYVDDVLALLSKSPTLQDQLDIFIIPDFITLCSVVDKTAGTKVLVGAQDAHFEDQGAFTGEVSPAVLAEVGCRIVELGHAERRRLFGETDADAAQKAAAAVRNGMIPLVCIGERTQGDVSVAGGECAVQVDAVLKALPEDAEVLLAYEPVWAIGAAEPADAGHVLGVIGALRKSPSIASRRGLTRIIYGGSAGPGLFERLKDGADGLFLGRFGHDPVRLLQTISEVASA